MIYGLILADLVMILTFVLKFSSLPPEIPLFYSKPWGDEQLIDTWFVIMLPLLLHVFFFLNIYTYNRFFFPDHFLRRIMNVVNVFLILLFTFIFVKVIFLVS